MNGKWLSRWDWSVCVLVRGGAGGRPEGRREEEEESVGARAPGGGGGGGGGERKGEGGAERRGRSPTGAAPRRDPRTVQSEGSGATRGRAAAAAASGPAWAASGTCSRSFSATGPRAASPGFFTSRKKRIDTLRPGSSFKKLKLGTSFKFGHG